MPLCVSCAVGTCLRARARARMCIGISPSHPYAATTTTQCKLLELKWSMCASGWKEKDHQHKLQRVTPPPCVQVEYLRWGVFPSVIGTGTPCTGGCVTCCNLHWWSFSFHPLVLILHLCLSNSHCMVVYIRMYVYIYIYIHILPYTTGLHTGNPNPFLYTPTSLLPEHSVLTDVQQATGRNGQQWIRCRSGGQWTRPKIWMGSELVVNSSTANSATMWLITQRPNGLYHCLSAQSQREYFSLYLRNSGKIKELAQFTTHVRHSDKSDISRPTATLPTPTASVWNNSRWSFTSPDGSRVDRYIVEFECRVRDITFVEKYTSVSASGGTGRVATSPSCVSCFGGQGQLYRVKVWAVNGPNISPALNCTPDGQCSEKGERIQTQQHVQLFVIT